MASDSKFTGPVNIGNPGEFTIQTLAETVVKLIGSNSKVVYKKLPVDDPRQRKPDIDLVKRTLNWQPTIELEEGLKRTIEYFETIIFKN